MRKVVLEHEELVALLRAAWEGGEAYIGNIMGDAPFRQGVPNFEEWLESQKEYLK